MVKTAPLDEDTHTFFKNTQLALSKKYKVRVSMSDILADISHALRHPEDAAKLILRVRHEKQEKAMNRDTEKISINTVDNGENSNDISSDIGDNGVSGMRENIKKNKIITGGIEENIGNS